MSLSELITVHTPSEVIEAQKVGNIFGYFHDSTNHINIISVGLDGADTHLGGATLLGKILQEGEEESAASDGLVGRFDAGGLCFTFNGKRCVIKQYGIVQDVFSRNTGILESSVMMEKKAIIVGCGSVGSLVALELAKAGVGHFLLLDQDIFEYHNICRHQCGASEVGRYKVDALKDRVLDINRTAQVETYRGILETVPKEVFDRWGGRESILVGGADNRASDIYGSKIASHYGMPFLTIGLWERAFAGEIFYSIPERNQPCYICPFGSGRDPDGLSNRVNANRRIYTTEENLEKVRFEPGISADIGFVTIIGIKLALDILNRNNSNYLPKVIDSLSQFTLICNTTDTRIGGEMAELFSYPLQVTTNIKAEYRDPCPPCKYAEVECCETGPW